jgi:hypothetical protein
MTHNVQGFVLVRNYSDINRDVQSGTAADLPAGRQVGNIKLKLRTKVQSRMLLGFVQPEQKQNSDKMLIAQTSR